MQLFNRATRATFVRNIQQRGWGHFLSPERRKNALLILFWIMIAAGLSFSRIGNSGFGLQGDLPLHYHITRSFAQSVAENDLLPRWAGLLDGGRGDSLFTFYPPLCYLLSAVLMRAFGIEVLTAIKIVLIAMLVLAQAGAYGLARHFFDRRRSMVTGLCYVLLPAIPLIGLHRGFFANAMGLSFAPFALLGAWRMLNSSDRAGALTIFVPAMSAVILTHTITTYLCAIMIGLMIVVWLPQIGWRDLGALSLGGMIVFGLTAFFLVPQQLEISWVRVGLQLIQQDYRNYLLFATPQDPSNYRQAWAGLNEVASYLTIAQSLVAIFLGLVCLPLLREKSDPQLSPQLSWSVRFAMAVSVFGLLIALPISAPLWEYLPGLRYVQFPWRFQPFVALACGLLAAAAPDAWPKLNRMIRTLLVASLFWIASASLALTFMLSRLDNPQTSGDQVKKSLIAPNAAPISAEMGRRIQNHSDLDYLPYAGNQVYFRPVGAGLMLYPPAMEPGGLRFIAGSGSILSQQLKISRREFVVECAQASRARLDTFYYPHWVARIDDREAAIEPEADEGLMMLEIPAGTHRVSFQYEVRNPYERAARLLSISAWILFGGWMAIRLRNRIKKMSFAGSILF